MISVNDTLFSKDIKTFKEIEAKAYYQLKELNSDQRVQDDIFRIIKNIEGIHLIKFPVEDEDLTAFKIQKKDIFIFINSHLPLDKQIFGGAHELYHVFYTDEGSTEEDLLKNYEESFNSDIKEMKANSFAACFLVPKDQLNIETQRLGIEKNNIQIIDIIKLMDIFAVPYKAMVLRLHECNMIDSKMAEDFLTKEDRNPKRDILLLIYQTRHAIRWQKSTNETEYSNLIELALENYREHIITKDQIEADFVSGEINERIENFLDEE